MQTPNNPFTPLAADAHANWKAALAELQTARDAFNNGAVVRLKEILGNQDALRAKLHTSNLDREQAETEFKAAFEASGFDKTAAVQKILNKKNDAIAICEALQRAIGQMQAEHQPLYIRANQEAESYSRAYTGAFNAYCVMSAMAQLEKHGPPLVDALALLKLVPSKQSGLEPDIGPNLGYSPSMDRQVLDARMNRLLGHLKTEASTASANRQDVTEAVGTLDLGPLNGHKFLTPGQLHMLKMQAPKAAA